MTDRQYTYTFRESDDVHHTHDIPVSLKNLINAYLIVNELALTAPGHYTEYQPHEDVDVSFIGQWIDQHPARGYGKPNNVVQSNFIANNVLAKAHQNIKKYGINTITISYLATVIITNNTLISKCRPDAIDSELLNKLLAAWNTYCYYVETDLLGPVITGRVLQGNSKEADDYFVHRVNNRLKRHTI